MKLLLLFALGIALAGCNSVSMLTSAGASGCAVGGFGTYGGSCTASVSGSPSTVFLTRR